MKQIARYRFLTVPNKLYADIRITVDESTHAETRNVYDGGMSVNLILLPMINMQILKPLEVSDTGRRFRPMSSQNDSIGMTKFNFPTFIMELKNIYSDMKTPDLYIYKGDRLDLNERVADNIRRTFVIGRTNIELKAVVIEQASETGGIDRVEGIKMKFNNEDSSVLLTLREIESMLWVMNHVDIDNLVLSMYLNLIERNSYEKAKPVVDIQPMSRPIYKASYEIPAPKEQEPLVNTMAEEPAVITPVVDVKPAKKEPVTQETVISIPAEKYKISDVEDKEDFSQYMNPPEPPVNE